MILSAVLAPLLGAFILPLVGKFSKPVRNILALLLVVFPLAISLALAAFVLNGRDVTSIRILPLGFNFIFHADALAVFMAVVSSLISAIIVIYSFGYISHYDNQNEYYMMVVLFLGAMMGLIYAGNLIFLYIFWEITAIASWRLIGFFRAKTDVLKADKSFLVTIFGALMMLLGFALIYQQTGSFDLAVIHERFKGEPISTLAVGLILIGIFSKSATLPFHTWLPDAGVAPSPVTALLHAAVLVKIGVYAFARLFVVTIPLLDYWHSVIPFIAGISAIVSAAAALIDTDLKRIIAYSTISQIAFIFLGLSIGNEVGIAGGLLYIFMHGLAKAGLFLCAGIVEQNTKIKDITQLGGLAKTMPVTAISFLFCAFSVMGIPPFGGFFCKYMVMAGALQGGHLFLAGMFLFGAFLTILYLLRVFTMVFLGESKTSEAKEGDPVMVFCVALLAVLSLAGGIFIYYPNQVVTNVVQQMLVMHK
ncbi:MAG: NADH-quinone oxidoreductase subunit L [Candidatus Omnitrophota bacterium]|jgi:proton-translocating NADH-quinone oxidoreductase chain N